MGEHTLKNPIITKKIEEITVHDSTMHSFLTYILNECSEESHYKEKYKKAIEKAINEH